MAYWGVVVLLRTGADQLRTGAEPLRSVLGRRRSVAYWGRYAPLRTGAEPLRSLLGQTCDHSSTFATVDSKGVER